MQKIILTQIILLSCTVLVGVLLKTGLLPVSSDIHRLLGITSGVLGIITVIAVFMGKQRLTIKLLALAVLLLTISAAIGGSSLSTATNYDLSYGQMVISGILALITSIVLYMKLKSNKPLR
ncbi:MAG: hypothetical protein KA035_02440 [Candidatus Levybacteria bacterium]|nr:hypothetical protein [Candidatus Levybacteria bacterium]